MWNKLDKNKRSSYSRLSLNMAAHYKGCVFLRPRRWCWRELDQRDLPQDMPATAQSGNHQVSEVPQEQIPHTPTTTPHMRKSTPWGGCPNRTPTPHGKSIRPAEDFPPSPPSLFLLVIAGEKGNIQDGREGQGPCNFSSWRSPSWPGARGKPSAFELFLPSKYPFRFGPDLLKAINEMVLMPRRFQKT